MVQVIAHRGASSARAENTLDAFRLAVEMGADWIELDVRRSADDVLVISHDAHIPDGRAIIEHDHADLPKWLPTLAEALEASEGAKVNIEIKNDPDEPGYDRDHQISDAVVGLALAYREPSDLLISSFNTDTVKRIKAIAPELPAGLCTAVLVMDVAMQVDRCVAAGLDSLHPWEHTLDKALIDAAHAAGLQVNSWTVNDPDRMREFIAWGIDGIISDVPDVARAVVDGVGQ